MLVSIVMGVYNGETYLEEAIASALAQTYPCFELVIVNDGSTDGTRSILENIKDCRVQVIHLEKNQGVANSLNIAIAKTRGNWISIHDADDISYPDKITQQIEYLTKYPDLLGVATLIQCIPGQKGKRGQSLEKFEQDANRFALLDAHKYIYYACPFIHSSVVYSKEAFWAVGGYNPLFKLACDYDLWLRLLRMGTIAVVPQVLLKYRVNSPSLSFRYPQKTEDEVKKASGMAIQEALSKGRKRRVKVILIGPLEACRHYQNHIGPFCNLNIDQVIEKDSRSKILKGAKLLKDGKVDGIIILKNNNSKKILGWLTQENLSLNKDFFHIWTS